MFQTHNSSHKHSNYSRYLSHSKTVESDTEVSTEVRRVCGPGTGASTCDLFNVQHKFWASTGAFHDGNMVEHHRVGTTTSAKVKIMWIYTSTPPYVFIA
jgi:hypothetical protein